MDFLKKTQDLFEEIKFTSEALDFIEKQLKRKDVSSSEWDRLYREEFKLAMNIAGAYGDLTILLDKMEKEEQYQFYVQRMRDNVKKYISVEVISVNSDF